MSQDNTRSIDNWYYGCDVLLNPSSHHLTFFSY